MAYKKTEQYEDEITSGLVKNYADILGLLGEDPEREGLKKDSRTLSKSYAIPYTGLLFRCKSNHQFSKIS
jgi:GTP cyclohydrolase I